MRCKFGQIVAPRIGQLQRLPRRVLFLPEYRFDAEFALLLNQAAEIVADKFAKDFVHHRYRVLAANAVSKLSLDRTERAFDVRPLAACRLALRLDTPLALCEQ